MWRWFSQELNVLQVLTILIQFSWQDIALHPQSISFNHRDKMVETSLDFKSPKFLVKWKGTTLVPQKDNINFQN